MAQVKKKKKPVQLCNKFDLRSRSPAGQFWPVAVRTVQQLHPSLRLLELRFLALGHRAGRLRLSG